MNNIKTYILGNDGFAKEVYDQVFSNSLKQFGGFIILKNNKAYVVNDNGTNPFFYPDNSEFVLGTGNKKWRKLFIDHFTNRYELCSKYFPNIVHQTAYVSSIAKLGVGNLLCPYALINGDPIIKDFNCFNIYSTISHDGEMGSYNILSPYAGIMGRCKIGNNNFLGANSIITPSITIGDDNTISAGEVVFDDMNNREFFQSGLIYKKP